jgi:hypothetical protein
MRPQPARDDQNATVVGAADLPEFEFAVLPFEEFSRNIDEGLALLVARWEHLAAPRAQRVSRISPIAF